MKCKIINKVSSGSPHIVDVLDSKKIALVINTGGGNSEHRLNDAIALRRATLKNKVPYCTNMSIACVYKGCLLKTKKLEVSPLQNKIISSPKVEPKMMNNFIVKFFYFVVKYKI